MPLPPALAARLAKRGILRETAEKASEPTPADADEEIIAEDYDDDQTDGDTRHDDWTEALVHETVACPNKVNTYHECSSYCKERWGLKTFRHDPTLDKKHARLLDRYPLDEGIIEVGDPETGRYYYWNTQTDEVSWLPPSHPRAKVSLPAERLQELKKNNDKPVTSGGSSDRSRDSRRRKKDARDSAGESESEESDNDDNEKKDEDLDQMEKEIRRRKEQSKTDRGGPKKKKKDLNLDPMDPAAYSDIPKGKWTTGLEGHSQVTGVDVTASGPLFQQRPYPNPGAVLRMNKE